MWIFKIMAGILGGVAGGMGMGGGTLTIPILTIFLSVGQLEAQGINLIAFIPMSIIALIIHFKNKLVEFKRVWGVALVGCVFSLIGALIASHINNGVLKKMFAVFLIILAVWQFVSMLRDNDKTNE